MNYHWNWAVFFQISPNYGVSYLQLFLNGVAVTLGLSASSWLIAMASGSAVGILRTLKIWPVRLLALCYVQVFRGIPLLVQMFLWYFILPQLVPPLKAWANDTDAGVVQFTLASICLGLYTSARIAEQVRSGLQALPPGQPAAAAALGMRRIQAYRYVLLPQTYRIIMPPLTSETMNLIKNTSIALTIGLAEITFRSREMGETTFAYFESFTIATFAYIVIALAANRASALIEHRLRHQKTASGPRAGSAAGHPLASRT